MFSRVSHHLRRPMVLAAPALLGVLALSPSSDAASVPRILPTKPLTASCDTRIDRKDTKVEEGKHFIPICKAAATIIISRGSYASSRFANLDVPLPPQLNMHLSPPSRMLTGLTTKKMYFYSSPSPPPNTVLFALPASKTLAKDCARLLQLPLSPLNVGAYNDGETHSQYGTTIRGKNVFLFCSTVSSDSMIQLLLTVSAARRASAKVRLECRL